MTESEALEVAANIECGKENIPPIFMLVELQRVMKLNGQYALVLMDWLATHYADVYKKEARNED